MTPKEKAEELVESMFECDPSGWEYMHHSHAIHCALIAVDEILNNNCGSTTDFGVNAEDSELYMDEYYWMEVKQEIEKL